MPQEGTVAETVEGSEMATVEVTEKAECEEGAHPEAAARVEVGREEAAGATATQPR